jgi:aldose 1-epimerase
LILFTVTTAQLHAQSAAAARPVARSVFGRTAEGKEVEQYTLTNTRGAVARVITYGAIVADLRLPDRAGKGVSVVREIAPSEQGFQRGFNQAAAVFGRYANRIAGARLTLDGQAYEVTRNNGAHHIHGGTKNFSRVVWQALPAKNPTAASIALSYTAADGEEGFPGRLTTTVTYTLTDENVLRIEYQATTDKTTVLNLTNHAFFNLAGSGDVLDHEIMINADRYTVVDADLIPNGKIEPVAGTALDFRRPTPVAARVGNLGAGRRYDNNFVLNRPHQDSGLTFAARVRDPHSGRTMEVWTTQPGVQLYTSPLGPLGPKESAPRFGFYCFETQHYPDSPNHPEFPTTTLRPGETFQSTTEYRFTTP